MTAKISIIIPTYTRHDKLRECLKSIIEYTEPFECEVAVVANGAQYETNIAYNEFAVVWQGQSKLLWFDEPLGYPKAVNEGIRATESEFVVLLNDDCLLLPQPKNQWIERLLKPMAEDPLVGLTGPLKEHDPNSNRDFLIFFCVMIRREVFDSIGILDEAFSPYFGEDTDFTIRAENVGWKAIQVCQTQLADIDPATTTLEPWKHDKIHAGNFGLFHDAESTIGHLPESEDVLRRNRALLRERYRVNDINIERARVTDGWMADDELEWLARMAKSLPEGSYIAEIGSWHGKSSRALADNLSEGSRLLCIDSWNGSSGEPEMHGSAQLRAGDHAHQWWWGNLYGEILDGKVIPVRMQSANAAEALGAYGFRFDAIFIDADHSYEGVKSDIEAWLPLLKPNGIMCGHDFYPEGQDPFAWMGVRQAVLEKFPHAQKTATSIWHVKPHEQQRGRVFDCFLFHNELDVLEIRLATLYDHVDYFVLVEAGETHSGEPKPLHFELNKERFSKYLDKIRHVVLDKFPDFPDNETDPQQRIYNTAWARERHQRDACMIALQDAQPNDIVIIGDADEIASPEAIANYQLSDGVVRLKQRMFYYYLNCENKEGWDWQKIAPFSEVKRLTPCGIRYPPAGELKLVESGGWHFSFLSATVDGIADKLRAYSHQEFNKPEIVNEDHIRRCRREGVDLFGRDLKYQFVEIDDSFPEYVKENQNQLFGNMLIHSIEPGKPLLSTDLNLSKKHWTVTAEVSTKNRYQTTLALTLSAIIHQTRLPDKLKIYDDSDPRIDLREQAPYKGLLQLATDKKIDWEVIHTPRLGQVSNHQHCLDNATTDFLWRVDDDEIPEPNCLEELLNTVRDWERGGSMERIGAVGGLVHHPGGVSELPAGVDGSLNDIASGLSIQWFNWNSGVRSVDHLYSTFLINVASARAAGGYPRNLSPVGHREESILTHSMKRAGYELLVTPYTKTHHLRGDSGGIRSNPDPSQWEHDEAEWQRLLKTWDVVQPDTRLIIADYGLGDTLVLRGIWPELQRKFPDRKWTLALCFPEVFKDVPDVVVISIADAKVLVGNKYDEFSLYKWMWDTDWRDSVVDAMKEFYGR